MRIAICDDEKRYRLEVKMTIETLFQSLDLLIDTYQTGKDLLAHFEKKNYDIVFLDIEMPDLNGILLAQKLRCLNEHVFLVFLTAHVEYALQGYEVNALRYLTKPVQKEKLKEVLQYVMETQNRHHFLWLKTTAGDERINVSDILYLEAQNQNIAVHTREQTYMVRYNLNDFEQELRADGFFRIHRGYLIALNKIKRLQKREVLLEENICLPVSRTKEKSLKEALYQYVKETAFIWYPLSVLHF